MKTSVLEFDPKTIEKLRKPAFKGRERLIDLAISDFLSLCKEGYCEAKMEQARALIRQGVAFASLPFLNIAQDFNSKDPDACLRVDGHEGRHRARALAEVGFTHMPVIFRSSHIRWSEQHDPERFDHRPTWPKWVFAQIGAANEDFAIAMPIARDDCDKPYMTDKLLLLRADPASFEMRQSSSRRSRSDPSRSPF